MNGATTKALIVAIAAALISCSSAAEKEMLTSKPDFVGFITEVQPDGAGRITVESHADKLLHRYSVKLTPQTLLFRRSAATTTPVNLKALKPKDWLEVWFTNPAGAPAEVVARQVVITDRPD